MKLSILVLLLLVDVAVSQNQAPKSSPAAQSADDQVYRVGGDVKAPVAIYTPQPNYPEQARKGHRAGPIVIWLVVCGDGRTRDVKVHIGISPELDQAAVEAVEKWQFTAATREGKPVAVRVSTEFDFHP